MNAINKTGKDGAIISTVGSADISGTMDGIGGNMGLQLEGEVQDLAGILNNDAAYDVKMIENAKGITSDGDWGYYAKQIAGAPSQLLKAWVRWNAKEAIYDYYLDAGAGEVFDHATPYVGTLY